MQQCRHWLNCILQGIFRSWNSPWGKGTYVPLPQQMLSVNPGLRRLPSLPLKRFMVLWRQPVLVECAFHWCRPWLGLGCKYYMRKREEFNIWLLHGTAALCLLYSFSSSPNLSKTAGLTPNHCKKAISHHQCCKTTILFKETLCSMALKPAFPVLVRNSNKEIT